MNLDAALAQFAVQLRADGRSPHTIAQYRRHVHALAAWLARHGRDPDARTVTHEDLARFVADPATTHAPSGAPKRETSLNALRSTLRAFFRYLADAGVLGADPSRLLRRARCAPPPPRALTDEERDRLLAALAGGTGPIAERDHALFHLLLATGIRLGSALALDVADVDLDARELTLRRTKGNRPDRVFLSPAIADHLARYVAGREHGPLFFGYDGCALSPRHVQRRLKYWLGAAGILKAVSPHALRHTFATRLYARTGDVLLVRNALHHRSLSSTMIYAQSDPTRLRAVLAETE